MQEEKIKLLTEKIIIELAPQGEVWESKKILDLLKKPKGEERINFWRDSLQIDMQALEGKTSLQKEKSLLKSIESSLLPCFENLVDQKKIYVLYEINAKKQKTTKYTLAFPWETYQCDTQKFLEGLQEEQKKHLAELALEQEKIKEQQRQNLERLALEQEKIKEQQRQN
ncbi:MAG: hypothetical protein HUU50_08030, partial [Candidatus Brocadiae bacterium]|nr:hypothetical protein [Candidatus Brocadiia bacterium]